jgi:hypothetical protein
MEECTPSVLIKRNCTKAKGLTELPRIRMLQVALFNDGFKNEEWRDGKTLANHFRVSVLKFLSHQHRRACHGRSS